MSCPSPLTATFRAIGPLFIVTKFTARLSRWDGLEAASWLLGRPRATGRVDKDPAVGVLRGGPHAFEQNAGGIPLEGDGVHHGAQLRSHNRSSAHFFSARGSASDSVGRIVTGLPSTTIIDTAGAASRGQIITALQRFEIGDALSSESGVRVDNRHGGTPNPSAASLRRFTAGRRAQTSRRRNAGGSSMVPRVGT